MRIEKMRKKRASVPPFARGLSGCVAGLLGRFKGENLLTFHPLLTHFTSTCFFT